MPGTWIFHPFRVDDFNPPRTPLQPPLDGRIFPVAHNSLAVQVRQLRAKDLDLARRDDPDFHVRAAHAQDADFHVFADAKRLSLLAAEHEHGFTLSSMGTPLDSQSPVAAPVWLCGSPH